MSGVKITVGGAIEKDAGRRFILTLGIGPSEARNFVSAIWRSKAGMLLRAL